MIIKIPKQIALELRNTELTTLICMLTKLNGNKIVIRKHEISLLTQFEMATVKSHIEKIINKGYIKALDDGFKWNGKGEHINIDSSIIDLDITANQLGMLIKMK